MSNENLFKRYLEQYLNKTVFTPNGELYFIKELVGKVRNLKIEIYSNDHNPPHFHVKSSDNSINATFRLDNCQLIQGDLKSKDKKRIEKFYEDTDTKELMKEMWNKSKTEDRKFN